MSDATHAIKHVIEHATEQLEMLSFNNGFEAALNAVDELSNELHNDGNEAWAEALRWVVKELLGENA